MKTRLLLSLMGIAGTALILGTGPALSETVSEAVEVRNAEPTSANDRESEDADRLLPLEVSEIQSAIGQQQAIAPKKSDRKTENAQSLGNISENPAPLNSAEAISESDNTHHSAIARESSLPPTISEKENNGSSAIAPQSTAVKDSETNGSQRAVTSDRNAVDTQERSAFDAAAVNATGDRDRSQQQQQQQRQTNSEQPLLQVRRLSEIDRPQTSADFLTQESAPAIPIPQPEAAQVTGVKLNRTATGVEILLETPTGRQLPFSQTGDRSDRNTLIIDIKGARLALPQGETFSAENPTTGITSVTASQLDTNTIRVRVTGETQLPNASVTAGASGLVVSVTPQSEINITVTAQKSEESIQNVPASITAITGRQVQDSGITSSQDIPKLVPNFSILEGGNRSRSLLNIRGLGNIVTPNTSGGSSLGFYVDDVPYSDWFSFQSSLTDIERIEVLRGPQGTLYGQNTQGGVVNIVTRAPTNVWEVRGSTTYGFPGVRENQLTIKGPVEENLFFSLSGLYSERDGFVRNTFIDELIDNRQSLAVRGQLRWLSPARDWDVRLGLNYEENNDGPFLSVPFDRANRREVNQDFIGKIHSAGNDQSLRVFYNGSGIRFTSITARREFRNSPASGDGDAGPLPIVNANVDLNTLKWSQEFRLQSPETARTFEWLVGGYYEYKETGIDVSTMFGSGGAAFGFPPATSITPAEFTDTTYAVFSQLTYRPTPPLTITGGLRFETRNFNMERQSFLELEGVRRSAGPDINLSDSNNVVLPKLAIDYRFSPNLMVYSSIARGYKNGGFSSLPSIPEAAQFDAERTWTYEIGTKTNWLNDRLLANVAFFYTRVRDYQVIDFVPPNISSITNAESANIWGLELELRAQPARGFDLNAGVGYTNARFDRYTNGAGVKLDGNRLPSTPEFTFNAGAQYRSPNGFLGRAEVQGFGQIFFDENNEAKQEPFVLVNARIGYEFDNFGVYLYGNNLFDKTYFTSGFRSSFDPNTQFFGAIGEGRTIGVQVTTKF
ncbi:MAG: TonB-dependent receptor [Microcoleus sp. PH2017_10_PVI_O_A]|uniref:TonB-dependent receptor domain-containing protein n=1 Tax=unclassified Microcoleus TaxID=2642155 RepID=UPI001D7CC2FE|nr:MULTISPECIES: TonB-dependent receptor [unclassified Microcoleus]MCC3409720.1 TonB-dependent receptor [Microcoleus sp. PH2017_10_PVI_O_A]MCC3463986.1 TonB-dependent receptor [Microcoleus sp. PH2017_11_PCY_U_A]MCC3482316.1 TonB-dependent receptor [Microcoleus sp. PH2017_12_PCY_D_A]MCC3563291.1 TonB-dependent receptor [Microcoleus sp. PH2017_27_LUM_O_A]